MTTGSQDQPIERLAYHWWWRDGWQQGRHLYACHFTFQDHPALQNLAAGYQQALSSLPDLEPIPPQWLHLTMQEVAFLDEISPDQLAEFAAVAAAQLAQVPAPEVTFHRASVVSEAVLLLATPAPPIDAVRRAIRAAIAETLVDIQPSVIPRYRPHVSVAYSNVEQPAAPVHRALQGVELKPVTLTLSAVSLIEYHRDDRMYAWTSNTPLPIGTSVAGR